MSESAAGGEGPRVVALPPVMDMAAATELKATLEAALVAGNAVRIEAGDVQRVATPALQVLVAAATSFGERGTGFAFGDCAPALTEAVGALGLGMSLGVWGE